MTKNSAVETIDPSEPLSPEAIVEQLRVLRQRIPEYVQLSNPDAKAIQQAAHLNAAFIDAAINAAGESQPLQNALGRTAADIRQESDDAGRWTAVEEELRAMLDGVVAANLVRRHRVGLTALQTYSISKQLARQKAHGDLLPHIETMKRYNKFGRRRGKGTAPQPAAGASGDAPVSTDGGFKAGKDL